GRQQRQVQIQNQAIAAFGQKLLLGLLAGARHIDAKTIGAQDISGVSQATRIVVRQQDQAARGERSKRLHQLIGFKRLVQDSQGATVERVSDELLHAETRHENDTSIGSDLAEFKEGLDA